MKKTIYVRDNGLWSDFQELAEYEDESVSRLIEKAMIEYIANHPQKTELDLIVECLKLAGKSDADAIQIAFDVLGKDT